MCRRWSIGSTAHNRTISMPYCGQERTPERLGMGAEGAVALEEYRTGTLERRYFVADFEQGVLSVQSQGNGDQRGHVWSDTKKLGRDPRRTAKLRAASGLRSCHLHLHHGIFNSMLVSIDDLRGTPAVPGLVCQSFV